jgi:hypothetical protein
VVPISPARTADAVRIEVTRFSRCAGFFTDCASLYYFRLSEIELIDEAGDNVALAYRDAKVSVPWTFSSYFLSPDVIRKTFGEPYNLGVKWNRIGQWGDWTCWAIVEQKKGEYFIVPGKGVRNSPFWAGTGARSDYSK